MLYARLSKSYNAEISRRNLLYGALFVILQLVFIGRPTYVKLITIYCYFFKFLC